MTTLNIPDWVATHYRESQMQFIRLYAEYAHRNKENHDTLEEEIHNIMMAMNLCLDFQQDPQAIDLMNDLGSFLMNRGYWSEGLNSLEKIVDVAERIYHQNPNEEKNIFSLASLQLMLVGFLLFQGRTQDAITILQQVLDSNSLMNNEMIAGGWGLLAGVAAQVVKGESEDILTLYRSSLEKIQPVGNLPLVSLVLGMIASILVEQGDHEKAIEIYWKKLEVDRQSKDIVSLIETYRGLAEIARHSGLTEIADQCYQDAADLAEATLSPELRYSSLRDLARSAYEKEDYITASTLYEKALTIARRIGNKSDVASTLNFLAFAREETGGDIVDLLQESLSISRDLNDYSGMTMAMIQLGDAYETNKESERAFELYRQAMDIATRIDNFELIALAGLQLGDLAMTQQHWSEAEHFYEQSIAAHKKYDAPDAKAMVFQRLGYAHLMQNKLQEAHEAVQTSANLHNQLRDWESYSEDLYALARIAIRKNEVEQARVFAQESLKVLKDLGSSDTAEIDNFLSSLPS